MMILPRAYFVVNVRYLIVGLKHILMCLEIVALPNLARPQSFKKSNQNFFDCWKKKKKKVILFLSYTFKAL